jgi:uncharacterized membrane protein YcgQ (UPF0703/DUF1980 family)
MPSIILNTVAVGGDPVFVARKQYVACVQATSWTSLTINLFQSADDTDENSWVGVGGNLTANAIIPLSGGLYLKATKTGAGTGTVTIRVTEVVV